MRQRDRAWMGGGGGLERGRHRIWNRLQALSCQHRAPCRAWTPGPWDHDPSRSRPLNRLSHPGTPGPCHFHKDFNSSRLESCCKIIISTLDSTWLNGPGLSNDPYAITLTLPKWMLKFTFHSEVHSWSSPQPVSFHWHFSCFAPFKRKTGVPGWLRACDSWSQGCKLKPHFRCRDYLKKKISYQSINQSINQ